MNSKDSSYKEGNASAQLSKKRVLSFTSSEYRKSKKVILLEGNMDKRSNFSASSNGMNKENLWKKPSTDKKVLTIGGGLGKFEFLLVF